MRVGICPICGVNLTALYRDLESRAYKDLVGTVMEVSIWAGKPARRMRSLRAWLRQRGFLRGGWWDRMTCRGRSRFLTSHLIPMGKQTLFPEPVLTFVLHSDWDELNAHMRNELESIRR